jgi:hypothetical protein
LNPVTENMFVTYIQEDKTMEDIHFNIEPTKGEV